MPKFKNIFGQTFQIDLVQEAWTAQKQDQDFYCIFVRFYTDPDKLRWYGQFETKEEADQAMSRTFGVRV